MAWQVLTVLFFTASIYVSYAPATPGSPILLKDTVWQHLLFNTLFLYLENFSPFPSNEHSSRSWPSVPFFRGGIFWLLEQKSFLFHVPLVLCPHVLDPGLDLLSTLSPTLGHVWVPQGQRSCLMYLSAPVLITITGMRWPPNNYLLS